MTLHATTTQTRVVVLSTELGIQILFDWSFSISNEVTTDDVYNFT